MFSNHACLSAYIDDDSLVTSDACEWNRAERTYN